MKSLFPADTYIVKNATVLNNEDRNILYKLYEPVIGSVAVSLYFTFWSNLDSLRIVSLEYTHHFLMASMRLKLEDILEAREKLEGIGLIKTYIKEGTVNSYVYELYSPLEASEFFDNPILSVALESNVGKREFNKIVKFFSIPSVSLDGYNDITSKFSDVFDTISTADMVELDGIRKVKNLGVTVDEKIDLNAILSSIPSEMLNHRSITSEIRNLIYKLVFIYNLDQDDITELIRNSINEKKLIDKKRLRDNCYNFYNFENKNSSPSLIYKKQPDYLRKTVSDNSKKSKMIYTFENLTPYDFLSGKNKGIKPSKSDLKLIETLLVDYDLTPGVVNVLVDYVLRINNNKLTKNFCLTIASQWKRSNIKTAEEAMELCRKENKRSSSVKRRVRTEKRPEWYDKNIESSEASDDDIKKLDDMLNSL